MRKEATVANRSQNMMEMNMIGTDSMFLSAVSERRHVFGMKNKIKTDSMQTGENINGSSVKIEIDSVEKIPNKRSYHKTIIGEDLTRIFVSVFIRQFQQFAETFC